MNNSIKLLLLGILAYSNSAQAIGSLRNRLASLARVTTKAQDLMPYLHPKNFNFKPVPQIKFSDSKNNGYRFNDSSTCRHAIPALGLGMLYVAYDQTESQIVPELTHEYIIEHIDQVKPELVRVFLQKNPDMAVTIYEAAMSRMDNDACFITTWSTPEETEENDGIPCSSTTNGPAPEHYNQFIDIIKETFLYPQVIEEWIKSDDKAYLRSLIILKAVTATPSNLLITLHSLIKSNSPILDKLLTSENILPPFLSAVYESIIDDSEKQRLEEKMLKTILQRHPLLLSQLELGFNKQTFEFMNSNPYPLWAYGLHRKANANRTQTEAHLFDNPQAQEHWIKTGETVRAIFYKIHEQEKKERAKGNYVFYHGQTWPYHLYADLYKQLWSIARHQNIGDDFTFVRFNEQKEAHDLYQDCLWLNHALYGNAGRIAASSAYYFYNNSSVTEIEGMAESLFKQLGMSHYFHKYQDELKALEKLHKTANENTNVGATRQTHNGTIKTGCGNMLLISVSPDKMNNVRPVIPLCGIPRSVKMIDGREVWDAKTVIDTLISKPASIAPLSTDMSGYRGSDLIEYTMPITTEYALDPKNGPRFYQFNAADPEMLKAYEQARDALFAKIKQDYQQNQTTKA